MFSDVKKRKSGKERCKIRKEKTEKKRAKKIYKQIRKKST